MKEIKSLTGVRGIAAIGVLLFHFWPDLSVLFPEAGYLNTFFSQGHVGVDLFFVLSGFIITYVYSSVGHWTAKAKYVFLVKRVSRIYPVHLVALLALAAMVAAAEFLGKNVDGEYSLSDFLYNVLMLQAMPISGVGGWNYPSWSVSAEFFGYVAIFPLTVFFYRWQKARQLSLVVGIVLLLGLLTIFMGDLNEKWMNIVRISFEFSIGASLFHSLQRSEVVGEFSARVLPMLVSVALTLCFVPESIIPKWVTHLFLVASCPVVIAGLSQDKGVTARILSLPIIRYLGLISYSLYMSHALVEKVFKVLLSPSAYIEASIIVRVAVLVCYIVSPLVVATAFYHLCEEPFRKRIQRRLIK